MGTWSLAAGRSVGKGRLPVTLSDRVGSYRSRLLPEACLDPPTPSLPRPSRRDAPFPFLSGEDPSLGVLLRASRSPLHHPGPLTRSEESFPSPAPRVRSGAWAGARGGDLSGRGESWTWSGLRRSASAPRRRLGFDGLGPPGAFPLLPLTGARGRTVNSGCSQGRVRRGRSGPVSESMTGRGLPDSPCLYPLICVVRTGGTRPLPQKEDPRRFPLRQCPIVPPRVSFDLSSSYLNPLQGRYE